MNEAVMLMGEEKDQIMLKSVEHLRCGTAWRENERGVVALEEFASRCSRNSAKKEMYGNPGSPEEGGKKCLARSNSCRTLQLWRMRGRMSLKSATG